MGEGGVSFAPRFQVMNLSKVLFCLVLGLLGRGLTRRDPYEPGLFFCPFNNLLGFIFYFEN